MSKVKAFGYVWETKLSRLWEDESVSLRQMALQLKVDPLTIKRHASQLGLPFPRPVARACYLDPARMLHPAKVQTIEEDTLEEHRKKWMSAVEEYQNMGVKFLRGQFPNVYTWLYRHDFAWLKTHLPPSKQRSRSKLYRIDWQKRDQDLVELVEISARRLKEQAQRPVRITISAIGKDIGQLALLQQHLSKLPLTAQLLEDRVETLEAFAIRRIQWIAKKYDEEHRNPKRWELIKQAGVERIATLSQVEEALDAALVMQPSFIPIP